MAGHALVLEHATGRLALSDRARVTVQLVRGGAVAGGALHVVALEHAGEAETARGAGDVDLVALLEQLHRELRPDLVVRQLLLLHAELAHLPVRLLLPLLEGAQVGLARVALLLLGELAMGELQRGVSVALPGPVSEDEVRLHLDHGHRVRGAVLAEHGGHPDLLADQSLRHGRLLLCLPRHCAHHGTGRRRVRDLCGPEGLHRGASGEPRGAR